MTVQDKLRWMEESGPLYVDMDLVVVRHTLDGVDVYPVGDGPEDGFPVYARNVSYAGWLVLKRALPGETVNVKCRCDEVACVG